MKKFICTVFSMVIVMLCSSCMNNTNQFEECDFIFNGISTYWITSNEDYIFTSFSNNVQMTDKKTGRTLDFIRDPFFEYDESFTPIEYIFTDEQNVYYLMSDDNSSYKIVCRKNDTLRETVLYEKILYKEKRDIFLGAAQTVQSDMNDIFNSRIPQRFCVIGNSLFLFSQENIIEVNLTNKEEIIISDRSLYNDNYGYYKGMLYFINSAYDICIYDIAKKEMSKLDDYKAQTLLVTLNGIYFSNAADGGRLHYIDFTLRWHKKITDKAVMMMDFDDKYIYYITEEDETVYCMDLYGGNFKKIMTKRGLFNIYCDKKENKIYLLYTEEDGTFAITNCKI